MAEKKQVIKTLEMHTGGEPLRIVLSGRKLSYILAKYNFLKIMHSYILSELRVEVGSIVDVPHIFKDHSLPFMIYLDHLFVQDTLQCWAARY